MIYEKLYMDFCYRVIRFDEGGEKGLRVVWIVE